MRRFVTGHGTLLLNEEFDDDESLLLTEADKTLSAESFVDDFSLPCRAFNIVLNLLGVSSDKFRRSVRSFKIDDFDVIWVECPSVASGFEGVNT